MDRDVKHEVIQRPEMRETVLNLGRVKIELADYETTGLCAVAVGPRGCGKTNIGQLLAEQLSSHGWCSIIFDPEREMELMYGDAVSSPEDLRDRLTLRDKAIVVVKVKNAEEFIPYGRVILEVTETIRRPLFVMVDEGQVFSSPKKRSECVGEAADILNQFVDRGRKRAIDTFVTALRYTGSVHRSLFSNANLTLIGSQRDSTAWSALSPQFKSAGMSFGDLNSLAPAEFMCLGSRGIEKVRMPMAAALKSVAPKAKQIPRALPSTFSQWDRAMREIPKKRLMALTPQVVALLSKIACMPPSKVMVGQAALHDELDSR